MNLNRLAFPQHPRPPQRELRQRGVFDSGGGLIGYVANVYVDEERNHRFVDVAAGGIMGWLGYGESSKEKGRGAMASALLDGLFGRLQLPAEQLVFSESLVVPHRRVCVHGS